MKKINLQETALIANIDGIFTDLGWNTRTDIVELIFGTTVKSICETLFQMKDKNKPVGLVVTEPLTRGVIIGFFIKFIPETPTDEITEETVGNWEFNSECDESKFPEGSTIITYEDTGFLRIFRQILKDEHSMMVDITEAILEMIRVIFKAVIDYSDKNATEELAQVVQEGIFDFTYIIENGVKIFDFHFGDTLKKILKEDIKN